MPIIRNLSLDMPLNTSPSFHPIIHLHLGLGGAKLQTMLVLVLRAPSFNDANRPQSPWKLSGGDEVCLRTRLDDRPHQLLSDQQHNQAIGRTWHIASSPLEFTKSLGVLREPVLEIAFSRDFSSAFFSFSRHVLSSQFPPNYHTKQILDSQERHAFVPGHMPFNQSPIPLTVIPLFSNSTPNVIIMHKYPDRY